MLDITNDDLNPRVETVAQAYLGRKKERKDFGFCEDDQLLDFGDNCPVATEISFETLVDRARRQRNEDKSTANKADGWNMTFPRLTRMTSAITAPAHKVLRRAFRAQRSDIFWRAVRIVCSRRGVCRVITRA